MLRAHGTEFPGSNPLNREHRRGVFACAACGLPAYGSDAKFESGAGWPSFYAPISGLGGDQHRPRFADVP